MKYRFDPRRETSFDRDCLLSLLATECFRFCRLKVFSFEFAAIRLAAKGRRLTIGTTPVCLLTVGENLSHIIKSLKFTLHCLYIHLFPYKIQNPGHEGNVVIPFHQFKCLRLFVFADAICIIATICVLFNGAADSCA